MPMRFTCETFIVHVFLESLPKLVTKITLQKKTFLTGSLYSTKYLSYLSVDSEERKVNMNI